LRYGSELRETVTGLRVIEQDGECRKPRLLELFFQLIRH
jgi:hypothetical protein